MGGARNIGTKSKTLEKFKKVQELLKQTDPKIKVKDALERCGMPPNTYFRLKRKYAKSA